MMTTPIQRRQQQKKESEDEKNTLYDTLFGNTSISIHPSYKTEDDPTFAINDTLTVILLLKYGTHVRQYFRKQIMEYRRPTKSDPSVPLSDQQEKAITQSQTRFRNTYLSAPPVSPTTTRALAQQAKKILNEFANMNNLHENLEGHVTELFSTAKSYLPIFKEKHPRLFTILFSTINRFQKQPRTLSQYMYKKCPKALKIRLFSSSSNEYIHLLQCIDKEVPSLMQLIHQIKKTKEGRK